VRDMDKLPSRAYFLLESSLTGRASRAFQAKRRVAKMRRTDARCKALMSRGLQCPGGEPRSASAEAACIYAGPNDGRGGP
jgi:hypothetical protein